MNKVEPIFSTNPDDYIIEKDGKFYNRAGYELVNVKGTRNFIKRAVSVFKDHFDYSYVNYTQRHKAVYLICRNYFKGFFYIPNSLYVYKRCPVCNSNGKIIYKKLTRIDICNEHGPFRDECYACKYKELKKHLNNGIRITKESFLTRVKILHGDKYEYPDLNFKNKKDKIKVICRKHGPFYIQVGIILRGHGCPKCSNLINKDVFITKAKKIHGNKYDYSLIEESHLNGNKGKVPIICKKHGIFYQSIERHLKGQGCPTCKFKISSQEQEIIDFLKYRGLKVKTRNRSLIKPYELDIVLPKYKLAIEFNGVMWHSYNEHLSKIGIFKNKIRHVNKKLLCENAGYKLLHIYEGLYENNKDSYFSLILRSINQIDNIIDDYEIIKVPYTSIVSFVEQNHFISPRFDLEYLALINKDQGILELYGYKINEGVISIESIIKKNYYEAKSGLSKVLDFLKKTYSPKNIIIRERYDLLSNLDDNDFTKHGFKLLELTEPKLNIVDLYSKKLFRIYTANLEPKDIVYKRNDKIGFLWDSGDAIYTLSQIHRSNYTYKWKAA